MSTSFQDIKQCCENVPEQIDLLDSPVGQYGLATCRNCHDKLLPLIIDGKSQLIRGEEI